MSISARSRIAGAVRSRVMEVQAYPWGLLYTGTREQIRRAGLVEDGCFPGDPGCPKSATHRAGPRLPGHWFTVRRLNARQCEVYVNYTEAELAQECFLQEAQERAARRAQFDQYMVASQARARTGLATMEGREKAKIAKARSLLIAAELMWNTSQDPGLGFSFDPEIVEEAMDHIHAVLRLYGAASMRVNAATLAEGDARFQATLARLTSPP